MKTDGDHDSAHDVELHRLAPAPGQPDASAFVVETLVRVALSKASARIVSPERAAAPAPTDHAARVRFHAERPSATNGGAPDLDPSVGESP